MEIQDIFNIAWKEWENFTPSPELGWWEFFKIFKLGYEKGQKATEVSAK